MKLAQAVMVFAISCCGNLCLAVKKEGISTEKKLTSSNALLPLYPAQKMSLIFLNLQVSYLGAGTQHDWIVGLDRTFG